MMSLVVAVDVRNAEGPFPIEVVFEVVNHDGCNDGFSRSRNSMTKKRFSLQMQPRFEVDRI